MSGSDDDWEKQLEDDEELEKNLNKEKKKTFADEDNYNSEEERKKKLEEEKSQPIAASTKKKQSTKKDYEKLFEERNNHKSSTQKAQEDANVKNMSKDARGEYLSKVAEQDIADSLFADMNVTSQSLNSEKDYIGFGKKVSGVLYQGQAPYRIPSFFKEVLRDLQGQLESKKIKEILDTVTTLYNEKVKEEKEKDKTGKAKAKKAPQLTAGKNTRDAQIISAMIGEDDYGDEEGEYGEEEYDAPTKAKKKVQEEEYDFM